jgi:nucleoside-diphosphate-sugar epimerase
MSELKPIKTVDELEERLSRPTPELITALGMLEGDIIILGVGGKMGPTLAMLAHRAIQEGGFDKRVIGVSRFSDPDAERKLNEAGIATIPCDLMDRDALHSLPEAPNVIYMAGTKFGTTGREALTWALNAYLPGLVVEKFRDSRIVLFSSGNVYPLVPVKSGGATESTPPDPIGEYAASVLGRERVFEHFARAYDTLGVIFRLNYAVETRYGVLLDIAQRVWAGAPVNVSMGHLNAIWQGDANAYALRSLLLAESPPRVLNVTGPEVLSVRQLALKFGEMLGKEPVFEGEENPTALLGNAGLAHQLMGYPQVPIGRVIAWVAAWVRAGGETLDKPTHFETRDGKF